MQFPVWCCRVNIRMMLVITYFVLFLVNSLVIYLANSFFPQQVVLGTQAFNTTWSIIHSMAVVALVNTFAIPFVRLWEKRRGKMLSSTEWMMAYFVVNLAGIWGVARFSEQFGLGIRSWMVAVVLALTLDFIQGIVMMQLEKIRSKVE